MTTPYFWRQPLQYLRWASHEKPAIFYSIIIGSLGPLTLFVVPPIRHRLGDGPRETIPLTYPGMFFFFFSSFPSLFCGFGFIYIYFSFIINAEKKKEKKRGGGGGLNEKPKGKSIGNFG